MIPADPWRDRLRAAVASIVVLSIFLRQRGSPDEELALPVLQGLEPKP